MAGYLSGLTQLVGNQAAKAPSADTGAGAVAGSLNPSLASALPQQSDPMSQLIQMRQISQGGPRSDIASGLAGKGLIEPLPNATPGTSGQIQQLPNAPVTGNIAQWIAQAEAATGVNPAQWTQGLALIAQHESGDNPNAINNWDSNAAAGHPSQGIMQTIPSTFSTYVPKSLAGEGIDNPVANIAAAIDYINARYGGIQNVPGVKAVESGGSYVGY